MGKLDNKVALITAATSGMALATAKLFVQEGAYVFITGRRQDKLDEAVKTIGMNITGVQGHAASLVDLDRLFETVKDQEGHIDVLFASAGLSGQQMLGSVRGAVRLQLRPERSRNAIYSAKSAAIVSRWLHRPEWIDCEHKRLGGKKRLRCKQGGFAVIRSDLAGGVAGS